MIDNVIVLVLDNNVFNGIGGLFFIFVVNNLILE